MASKGFTSKVDFHVFARQVAVRPDGGADEVWSRPPAACAPAALGCGDFDGEWLDLAFFRPVGRQCVSDRRVQLCFVDVGEGGLAHQCGLRGRGRCSDFFCNYPADGAAAAPRPGNGALFEQRVTRVPVTVLAPAQGAHQCGVPDGRAVGRHMLEQACPVCAVIITHGRDRRPSAFFASRPSRARLGREARAEYAGGRPGSAVVLDARRAVVTCTAVSRR
jgi:hypothetical protein